MPPINEIKLAKKSGQNRRKKQSVGVYF